MRYGLGVLVLMAAACGAGKSTSTGQHQALEPEGHRLSTAERANRKEIQSAQGKTLGLILYDHAGQVIGKDVVEPDDLASVKVCLQAGEASDLDEARFFVTCCDKDGIADLKWQKVIHEEEVCWTLSPVYFGNVGYNMSFTFSDADTARYENKRYFHL